MTQPTYDARTIQTALRPARCAILVDINDTDWMQTCLRITEWSSAIWGGWYFILVPTDGQTINPMFWDALELYDPDYVRYYYKTGRDIEISDPARFTECLGREWKSWCDRYPDATGEANQRAIKEQIQSSRWSSFQPGEVLVLALYERLNAFRDPDGHSISAITCRSNHERYPLTHIEHLLPHLKDTVGARDFDFDGPLVHRLMVHGILGRLRPTVLTPEGQHRVNWSHQTPEQSETLAQHCLEPPVMSPASIASCAFFRSIEAGALPRPLWIVAGNTIEDFCLYYDLQRLYGSAAWIPHADPLVARCESSPERALEHFDRPALHVCSQLMRGATRNGSEITLTSTSLSENELLTILQSSQFASSARTGVVTQPFDVSFRLWRQRLYEIGNTSGRYRDQFVDGKSVSFIPTPKPKHLTSVPPESVNWITDVAIEAYTPPSNLNLGPDAIDYANYDNGLARASDYGFSYLCPNFAYFGGDIDDVLVRPRLSVMSADDVFSRLFHRAGYTVNRSDKGNYAAEIEHKLGSLDELTTFLRRPASQAVLEAYTKPIPDRNSFRDRCCTSDRWFLRFGAFASAYLPSADSNKVIEPNTSSQTETESSHSTDDAPIAADALARQMLDDWIARGLVHRGLLLKCDACRQLDFYPLGAVAMQFTCSRCRRMQTMVCRHWRMPDEPSWFYKLDEVVYQFARSNGHVSVLALAALKARGRRGFMYLHETDLEPVNANDGKKAEIDIVCSVDGEVFLGEAKLTGDLDDTTSMVVKRLKLLETLMEATRAKGIILATYADGWSDVTRTNATNVLGDRVQFLTRSDLMAL